MAKPKKLDAVIIQHEYQLAKLKFVQSHFPDTNVHQGWGLEYSSPLVNANYTDYDFEQGWSTLNVVPYSLLDFSYNGKDEQIKIYCSPRRKRLLYRSYGRYQGKSVIKFCRFVMNFKNSNFSDKALHACKVEIMNFLEKHPNHHLDTKHLDPKLKDLLAFI